MFGAQLEPWDPGCSVVFAEAPQPLQERSLAEEQLGRGGPQRSEEPMVEPAARTLTRF